MANRIDTSDWREKLKPRNSTYWVKIVDKCHLGFRKLTSDSTGTWQARFNNGIGTIQQHSLGSLDEHAKGRRYEMALRDANIWFGHVSGGGSAKSITVAEACERYVAIKRDQKNENAAKDLEGRYNRWVYPNQRLGSTLVMKLLPKQLYDWKIMLINTPALLQDKAKIATKLRAPGSVNRDMAALSSALNQAVRDGHSTNNTAWSIQLVRIENTSQERNCYLNEIQRQKLIDASSTDLAIFVKALSRLPLRPGAMAQLTVSNYDPITRVLTIAKDKARRGRKFPLPTETAEFFDAQTINKSGNEPIFPRADGKFWNKDSWKGPFKIAVSISKLPLEATAYSLRHSTITDLIVKSKLDLVTLAQISGTSVLMIQKHYAHLVHDHVTNALSFLKTE